MTKKFYVSEGIGCGSVSLVMYDNCFGIKTKEGEPINVYMEFDLNDRGKRQDLCIRYFSEPLNERYPNADYEDITEERYLEYIQKISAKATNIVFD